ncbi:MAG: hypothetical protein Q7R35_08220, partial [Elusimicrobiota bacterium]|nr:hypothetical protein [Elusimicrobiota bacterium]
TWRGAINLTMTAKTEKTISPELLDKIDAYWRAANYLSVGQIYLRDNPAYLLCAMVWQGSGLARRLPAAGVNLRAFGET